MKTEAKDGRRGMELQFELKYCERCGGLWLRPMGGEQVYCGSCWSEMNKLPRGSRSKQGASTTRGVQWIGDGVEVDFYDHDEFEWDGLYLDEEDSAS
jgi:Zn-finger nucleic acid-binding protein